MDDLFFGLAILFLPLAALYVLTRTRRRVGVLEQKVAGLERRLAALTVAGAPAVARPVAAEAANPQAIAGDLGSAGINRDHPSTERDPVSRPAADPAATPTALPADGAGEAPPQARPASAPGPGPGLEERFGTKWVVWVGGIALALGGVFMVRFSIEAGMLGPGVRMILAGLFAAGLVAAGEFLRRNERGFGIGALPSAHIPSILTAAGTTAAYAAAYGAYALYDLIPPGLAFVLLCAIALGTLAASLLHGPALAGLGLVGAELAPLLIDAEQPDYWALYPYLAIVTAASFGLARARLWRWLALTAVGFALFWTIPGLVDPRVTSALPFVFHVVSGHALAAALIVGGLLCGPPWPRGRVDPVSSGTLTAYVLAAGMLVLAHDHSNETLAGFAILVIATIAIAWRSDSAVGAVTASALVGIAVMAAFALPRVQGDFYPDAPSPRYMPDPPLNGAGLHLMLGAVFAGLYGTAGFLAQGRSTKPLVPILWASAAALAPIGILVALYLRVAGIEPSIPFATLALALGGLYIAATGALARRPSAPGSASAEAIFAAAAVASLALALTLALSRGWLTVGLALMVPGIAWVALRRPLPMLRWLAAILATLVVLRVGWEPRIVGSDVGDTPIFNWLLYGYGMPALSFWAAGFMLRRRGDDKPSRMVDAAAILFTVLLAFVEIRHLMNRSDIYAETSALGEIALQVSTLLAMTIGLEWLRGRTGSIVHDLGAVVLAVLSLMGLVGGLWLLDNPILTSRSVGGPVVNFILLGYGLPAILSITLALIARRTRPMAYRAVAAGASVVTALLYLSLQIARIYHGPVLTRGPVTDAEQYTYSAVWLGFGVVLLLVGILVQSKPARLASAAVVLLTVGKVFLIDMADLTGVWRALSFMGLGLVLVGIGLLYQRLLFPNRRSPAASTAESAGADGPG